MTDSGRPGQSPAGKAAKAGKQERLAARLRENLRKRKAQGRARAQGETGQDEAGKGDPDRDGAGET